MKKICKICACFSLLFLLGCFNEEVLTRIANEVDIALSSFKEYHKYYPIKLDELVPVYLDVNKIDKGFKLERLNYKAINERVEYQLLYDASFSGFYVWYSSEKKWKRAEE